MLYVIRHGETELNSKHVLQGRSDNPLNEMGFKQADEASAWFKNENISFSKIYSSPLIRAIQTAERIEENALIITDDRLLEMDYGPYEGMSLHSPAKEVLEFFSDFTNNPAPKGMEQLSDVVKRTGDFTETIRTECALGNILISTHAIAMKGILEYLDKDSKGKYWSKNISNCEVYAISCEDGKYGLPQSVFTLK